MDERHEQRPLQPPERAAGFMRTMRAVLWGFFGVRRGAEYEKDAAQLNAVHVIVAGIVAAVLFVIVLVMIARSAAG